MREENFFKETTLRICGSLNLELAIWQCLVYLRDVLPADIMTVHLNKEDQRVLNTLVKADISEGKKMNDFIPISEEVEKELLIIEQRHDVTIHNDSSLNPLSRLVHEFYNDPPCSSMILPLTIENQIFGAVVLRAFGKNKYTKEHAAMFSQLNGPFTIALSNALKHQELVEIKESLVDENLRLRKELQLQSVDGIIGSSAKWKAMMEIIGLIAPLDSPVLLQGETGVGKEVVANAIHGYSRRKNAPFVKINCGGLPESLLDSALFGHEKGAFTGADSKRKGFFERAHTGTIFLDEIGDMPPSAQIRLLRVLQNRELERVGGAATITVDTRIIAACQNDLGELVQAGRFRPDLWFRLNVFPITIPPLRERKEDIPDLVRHFVKTKSKRMKLKKIPRLDPDIIDQFMDYEWPGNVRELENAVERTLIMGMAENINIASISPIQGKKSPSPEVGPSNLPQTLDELFKTHVETVLKSTNGKIYGPGGAAELLDINPNTLRNRLKKMGIAYLRRDRQ